MLKNKDCLKEGLKEFYDDIFILNNFYINGKFKRSKYDRPRNCNGL